MTNLLYLDDCYIKEFQSSVIKSFENYVVLDETIFYPVGGGQPSDMGFLNNSKVIEVIKKDGEIRHILDNNVFNEGEEVLGKIDWNKRYKFMRMHSAQHLLSGIILNHFDAETAGNQISMDESRIDFIPFRPTQENLLFLEKKFNEIVDSDVKISILFMSREKINEKINEKRRNLFHRIPEYIDLIRVITIGDIDVCPCGGTHLRKTSEIGYIKFISIKNKGKGVTRLTFSLEDV